MSEFLIVKDRIVGLIVGKARRRWKRCKWCGKTFMPHHNKQAYCDRVCQRLKRQKYKRDWNYKRRCLERDGMIINEKSILNVGTGGLGMHRHNSDAREHHEVLKELRRIGLR